MQVLDRELLKMVGGGVMEMAPVMDDRGGFGFSDYWDSRVPDYEFQSNYDGSMQFSETARNSVNLVSSAAGWGVMAVVTGTCMLVPTVMAGPAAPEAAALVARPCALLGTVTGGYAGSWVSNKLSGRARMLEQ